MAYVPPNCSSIPFVFTSSGYTPPLCSRVVFDFSTQARFGTLQAAINVMRPFDYLNDTYTYVKSCPTYVVGYNSGAVQIMKGRCSYGGIRDINASVIGLRPRFVPADMSANIEAFVFSSLSAYVRALKFDILSADIFPHNPANMKSSVTPLHKTYSTIRGSILALTMMDIVGIVESCHQPGNLNAFITPKYRGYSYLNSSLHSLVTNNLSGIVTPVQEYLVKAYVQCIPPNDLYAYLNIIELRNLSSNVHSWCDSSITAYIRRIHSSYISSKIVGRDDMLNNVRALIKGYDSSYGDVGASVLPMNYSGLNSLIRATYLSDISMYIYAVTYKCLGAAVYSWKSCDLQASINGYAYPWQLSASIVPSGVFNNISANIMAIQGNQYYSHLLSNIHVWKDLYLRASVISSNAPMLNASLNIVGNASNLHASLFPKVIRLTTIVNISTLASNEMSAIINSPCFYTNYNNLKAFIHPKFKFDLQAYVKAIAYNYEPSLLQAKVGYSNSYTEIDYMKLNLSILPSDFYTLDKYKVTINILDAAGLLQASINGTLRFNGLNAQIDCVDLRPYTFDNVIKNTETAINMSYNGTFISNETVEMSFKTVVGDYYYSSEGDYLWKSNRLDKWMLDVKSFYPVNTALKLKRRLHRATTLYDLKKFISVDEAMRYAIAYVTDTPASTLSASVFNSGSHSSVGGVINPQYTHSSTSFLNSSITPVGNTVIVGLPVLITKI